MAVRYLTQAYLPTGKGAKAQLTVWCFKLAADGLDFVSCLGRTSAKLPV